MTYIKFFPTLTKFELDINDLNINVDEIIEIFKLIIESTEKEVIIKENQRDTFISILNILDDVNDAINKQQKVNFQEEIHNSNVFECDYEGDELSGIIACIKQMNHSNSNDQNDIKLSSGCTVDPKYPLSNIIEYDRNNIDNYFYNFMFPVKKDDGWLEFDFGNKKIHVSSYTIRTSESWKIIGSYNHLHWDIIDLQNNNMELNCGFKQHRFICKRNNKFYQYIRYLQINAFPNNDYKNFICLT